MHRLHAIIFATLVGTAFSQFLIRQSFLSQDCTGSLLEIGTTRTDTCILKNGDYTMIKCDEQTAVSYKCSKDCTECSTAESHTLSTCAKSQEDDQTSEIYSCDTVTQNTEYSTTELIARFLPREYFEAHYRYVEALLTASAGSVSSSNCPYYAAVFGALGSALGLAAANAGAAFGIAISFGGYISLGQKGRTMLIKGLVPAIMASVRGVYGLIISILIAVQITPTNYSLMKAFAHLFAGLSVGLSGLASGYCMGVVGKTGMIAVSRQPRLYIGILLILIFAEAIGLYGLIIGLILLSTSQPSC